MIASVQIPLLQDLLLILGASVGVVLLFQRLRLPSILGFLFTGVLLGPYGLILINATHEIELMAEIGVILLLFVIGMEFSLRQLNAIRKTVFIGGALQVFGTIALATGIFYLLDYPLSKSVFLGFLFALSSTAIVLRLLQDSNKMHTPHGQIALGILIFQDLIVVPMMLLTPMLAGATEHIGQEILWLLGKTAAVVLITIVSARYLIPPLLHKIAQTRSKELFLLATVALCFAVAFLTSAAGLSLALGAFLAGLIISESPYSHQATSIIIPFREIFTSFFFVSIGMLLNIQFLVEHLLIIIIAVIIVTGLKGLIVSFAAWALRYPLRTVMLTGFALFQVGEFAFILSKIGLEYRLLTPDMNQYFLSVSIITMGITPFVLQYAEQWTNTLTKKAQKIPNSQEVTSSGEHKLWENHLIIIGFGINGHNVARAARLAGIPYVILEMNPDTVRQEKAKREPILYGDAVNDHILHEVNISKARVAVVAISDPHATRLIVANIRLHNPTVHLIIRTRFVKETDELLELGANEVIPEEFETSIEIFTRVLSRFLVPMDQIAQWVQDIRAESYSMLRPGQHERISAGAIHIPHFNISSIRVQCDGGPIVGHTLAEAQIRNLYEVTVLGIERNGELLSPIPPSTKIQQHDLLFVSGKQEDVQRLYRSVAIVRD